MKRREWSSKDWRLAMFLSLCMLAVAVMPATALHMGKNEDMRELKWADSDLKQELWRIHADYRMGIFALRLNRTEKMLDTLDAHGFNISEAIRILERIEGMKLQLQEALEKQDPKDLREVNRELSRMWREFRRSLKSAIVHAR
ncbi:MAG: hypothetical protein QHG99_04360 [Methanomicrobiales archaeon]|nr:hypothetical protein [Methanomicrobiales archaeon]